ncbi:MAG: glycosyltransferase family 2 protein, partial [Myxococcota bacterium]
MLEGACIAVVVPAHDESALIRQVLDTIPAFVDHVIVVDDASRDDTVAIALKHPDPRVHVLRHPVNRGVGAAIATGYRIAVDAGAHIVAVMAGDGQMDPADLPSVVRPVLDRVADYVKGVRLQHPDIHRMPLPRRVGTKVFGWATRHALGLPALTDSQCGYTAISADAIRKLDLQTLWPRFGYPNDLLGQLAMRGLRVAEVPVRPIYGQEKSELRARHALVIAWLIGRAAWRTRRPQSTGRWRLPPHDVGLQTSPEPTSLEPTSLEPTSLEPTSLEPT